MLILQTSPLCTVLDGYDNLAKLAGTKVTKDGDATEITELTDLNLETKLDTSICTVVIFCDIKIALPEVSGVVTPYGVYKIILYGPTETSDVADWEVRLCKIANGTFLWSF